MKSPIFAALDIDEPNKVLEMAEAIQDYVGGFKIGPRLSVPFGKEVIRQLSEIGAIFVDNKYHDIPNTMAGAVRATFEEGASFTTVHASAGFEALQYMADLEAELNTERPFKILAVTVLTSLSQSQLPPHWKDKEVKEHVLSLANLAVKAGITGLVCSAQEVGFLREEFPEAFLVTPGIRLAGDSKDDQKRIMGPADALEAGASALVVGRPICHAEDYVSAAKKYHEAIVNCKL